MLFPPSRISVKFQIKELTPRCVDRLKYLLLTSPELDKDNPELVLHAVDVTVRDLASSETILEIALAAAAPGADLADAEQAKRRNFWRARRHR